MNTRAPTPIPWSTLIRVAPACVEYAALKHAMILLERDINSGFESAWTELASELSLKSTLFVTDEATKTTYNFRIGTSISEKVIASHKSLISKAYAEKDAVLEAAASENDAFIRRIANFTVSFPGIHPGTLPSQDRIKELVALAQPTNVKLKLTLTEFEAKFPCAAPLLLKRNTYRILEKQAESLWDLASAQLQDHCPTLDTTYQTTNPLNGAVYTIALFSNQHIELKKIPNNKKFTAQLARAYKNITDVMDTLRMQGLTESKITPFFSAYTT
jgi:hypothetical protein